MRKKSDKKAAAAFKKAVEEIEWFVDAVTQSSLSDNYKTWAHDYATIRLYREFENLMLNCVIAALNRDTTQLSSKTGVSFPKHLTDEVCEFLIVGDGYFDFRGRDGLIQTCKRFLRDDHHLVTIVKKAAYKPALERLSALRNFAAHDSKLSKKRALKVIEAKRLVASGAWLKRQRRFDDLARSLTKLADEIADEAPY